MKKVYIKTVTRQITSSGDYKPNAPIFSFVNTGTLNLIINENYILKPGESFGVGLDTVVAVFLKQGIPVVNETAFKVDFKNSAGAKFDGILGKSLGTAHIIETFVELR